MPLSDTAVRNAKPKAKAYKLADEKGLYLLVNAVGRYWRLDYRFGGKRKTLALGVYSDVSLAAARVRRDEARRLLASDIDPSVHRQVAKNRKAEATANSFEAIASEWIAKFSPNWADTHTDKIKRRLERDVFPWLGNRPIAEITAPQLLVVLQRIEARGALDTAHRAHQNVSQVFRYAIATVRAERDPSADLRGALPPAQHGHYASIKDPAAVGTLLREIMNYSGSFVTKCALRLAPYTFVRPGELRKAEWSEFDLDKAEWRIPAEKMKMGALHIVPLSSQAVEVLRELLPLTGSQSYLFPGVASRRRPFSMSEAGIAT